MKNKHWQPVVRAGQKDYASLADALLAAADGEVLVLLGDAEVQDTVRLTRSVTLTADGVEPRTIRFIGCGAAMEIGDGCTVAGGSADAPLILDGCGIERDAALLELAGEGIELRHVTVRGGSNRGRGGAVYAAAGSKARMEYCTLCGNRAAVGGAGFVDVGADLKLHRCVIADNHAADRGGAFRLQGKMLPTGCTIVGNTTGTPQGRESRLGTLPAFDGRKIASLDGEGTELAVWETAAGADSYESYTAKLQKAGFTLLREEQLEGNRCATFGGKYTLTLMDTPALQGGTVRLAIDDGEAPLLDCGTGDAVTEPLLVQLGTGCATMQNGAALLFRLADGRFVVVDGGYTDDAAQLWHTMKQLSPTGKVRIALWMLTHAHGDHLEAFLAFWQQPWARDVVLEKVLMNLPGDETFAQSIVGAAADVRWKEKMEACLAGISPAPQVICAHPGQKLPLTGGELTVLYTAELMAPREVWSFNDTSLVCRLRLGDTDFLLLGDCAVEGGEVLTALYDGLLQCHVLQASHHGHYNNAPHPTLYEAADAPAVLWCSTWERFFWSENRAAAANRLLFSRQQEGKTNICCAGGMVRTFGIKDGHLIPLAVEARLRDAAEKEGETMDIKLVGLDLDGTLLDDERKVRQRTIDALRLAADHGIHLAVISGRNFLAVPEEIRALPFIRYFVLCNGAGIYDRQRDELLFQADIPLEEALALYDALDEEDVYYDCYLSDGAWTPQSHYDRIDEFVPVESHCAFLKVNRKPFDDFRGALRQRGKSLWKVQSIYKDTATRDREMARLQEKFPQYTFVTAYTYNLEINMPAATKGSGLMQLAEILGLDRAQVMAFGDGGNDVTMLQSAGVGVAMGNACAEAKAAAACVGPTNNEDGVAQVLEALVCGGEQVRSVCTFKE